MPAWLQSILVVVAIVAAAPVVAWSARRFGGRAKAGVALAGLLLGLGQVADPPSRHLIEATDGEENAAPSPGDPPAT
jgi:4-amino-4-deoxy-L-arabinose transferase-like glycosyltransferase